jgi:hypothetical protein
MALMGDPIAAESSRMLAPMYEEAPRPEAMDDGSEPEEVIPPPTSDPQEPNHAPPDAPGALWMPTLAPSPAW